MSDKKIKVFDVSGIIIFPGADQNNPENFRASLLVYKDGYEKLKECITYIKEGDKRKPKHSLKTIDQLLSEEDISDNRKKMLEYYKENKIYAKHPISGKLEGQYKFEIYDVFQNVLSWEKIYSGDKVHISAFMKAYSKGPESSVYTVTLKLKKLYKIKEKVLVVNSAKSEDEIESDKNIMKVLEKYRLENEDVDTTIKESNDDKTIISDEEDFWEI